MRRFGRYILFLTKTMMFVHQKPRNCIHETFFPRLKKRIIFHFSSCVIRHTIPNHSTHYFGTAWICQWVWIFKINSVWKTSDIASKKFCIHLQHLFHSSIDNWTLYCNLPSTQGSGHFYPGLFIPKLQLRLFIPKLQHQTFQPWTFQLSWIETSGVVLGLGHFYTGFFNLKLQPRFPIPKFIVENFMVKELIVEKFGL